MMRVHADTASCSAPAETMRACRSSLVLRCERVDHVANVPAYPFVSDLVVGADKLKRLALSVAPLRTQRADSRLCGWSPLHISALAETLGPPHSRVLFDSFLKGRAVGASEFRREHLPDENPRTTLQISFEHRLDCLQIPFNLARDPQASTGSCQLQDAASCPTKSIRKRPAQERANRPPESKSDSLVRFARSRVPLTAARGPKRIHGQKNRPSVESDNPR